MRGGGNPHTKSKEPVSCHNWNNPTALSVLDKDKRKRRHAKRMRPHR